MATRTATLAVELQNVTKNYGSTQALKGISLKVEPGEVVAVLGPNGAGKTTSIALMLGLRRPSSGSVTLFVENSRLANHRKHIGVINQGQMIADGTPDEIKGHVGGKHVRFRAPNITLEDLRTLAAVQSFWGSLHRCLEEKQGCFEREEEE